MFENYIPALLGAGVALLFVCVGYVTSFYIRDRK